MLGRELAERVEFVAQVVQGVVLAVRVGAEGGPGGGDQVVQVGKGPGEPGTEPADLGNQKRNRVEGSDECAHGGSDAVVSARYLLEVSVRVVGWFGRDDHLPYPWPVRARMMAVMVVRISGARVLVAR